MGFWEMEQIIIRRSVVIVPLGDNPVLPFNDMESVYDGSEI
jgi:hypothetical protein